MASEPNGNSYPVTSVSAEEVHQTLERILSSKYFAHAPKKQKFLQLICDFYLSGRARELNEYLIGCEVFDRATDYNPSVDPIVRVGAREVRKKLETYYQNEGAKDEIRLEIPVGSYEPVFVRQLPSAESVSAALAPSVPLAAPQAGRGLVLMLEVAVVALVITVGILAYFNLKLQPSGYSSAQAKNQEDYGAVWAPFLNDPAPPLLVLSNPPVYRFSNVTDPEVLIKNSIGLSNEQAHLLKEELRDKFIMQHNRIPRLILTTTTYTGIGEAIGLHRVTDLFRSLGKSTLLKQSRTVSVDDLKNHNVILLGSIWVNEWAGKLPLKEDFVYSGDATILNLNPLPGEEREYKASFDERSGRLLTDYAVITVKPNISDQNTVMVLAGIHSEGTEAAAEYVTTRSHLAELNQRLLGDGGPVKYFQALLKVGVENAIPTTISIVALHQLSQPAR